MSATNATVPQGCASAVRRSESRKAVESRELDSRAISRKSLPTVAGRSTRSESEGRCEKNTSQGSWQ